MSDELLLSIEKLVYGGDGLTHADGNTVFVPLCFARRRRARNYTLEKEKTDLGEITGSDFACG